MHRSLHFERVVIVTASVLGADNHATHYGMAARPGTALSHWVSLSFLCFLGRTERCCTE